MSKPVCLVTGVGPAKGTGAEVAKRFSTGGYQVAMLARNKDNLAELEQSIKGTTAFPCDVGDLEALINTIEQIRKTLGNPTVVVHNAAKSSRGGILELDPEEYYCIVIPRTRNHPSNAKRRSWSNTHHRQHISNSRYNKLGLLRFHKSVSAYPSRGYCSRVWTARYTHCLFYY